VPSYQPNASCLQAMIKIWLERNALRPAWLSQQTRLSPSILSRFLNQKRQLDEVSALRVYNVIKWRMSPSEQQSYLEAAGLLDLIVDALVQITPNRPPLPYAPYHPLLTGVDYMRAAYAKRIADAIPLFYAAERAFGPGSTNAAYAACEASHGLTMLGDIPRASGEYERIATTYAGVMDIVTQARYATVRGYMEFDRGDLGAANRWFRHCIDLAQQTGAPDLADESYLYMVLIPVEIARCAPDAPANEAPLAEADRWMEQIIQHDLRDTAREQQSWLHYFRRSQLREAQGRHLDAQSDRKMACESIGSQTAPSLGHFNIKAAELALERGDTKVAMRHATHSLEDFMAIFYIGGTARATRVMATAALMEGKLAQALELVIAAASINPFGTYQDRAKLDQVIHDVRARVQNGFTAKEFAWVMNDLRAKAESHQDAFKPLSVITPSPITPLDDILKRFAP
jgi:hypothetical protein